MDVIGVNNSIERFTQAVLVEAGRVVPSIRVESPGRRMPGILRDVDSSLASYSPDVEGALMPWQQLRAWALIDRWLAETWEGVAWTRWVNGLTESAYAAGAVYAPEGGLDLLDAVLEAIRGGYREGALAGGAAAGITEDSVVDAWRTWSLLQPTLTSSLVDRLGFAWWMGDRGEWRREQVMRLDAQLPGAVASAWCSSYGEGWTDARAVAVLSQPEERPWSSRAAEILSGLPGDARSLAMPGLSPWQRRRGQILFERWWQEDLAGTYRALTEVVNGWGDCADELFALMLEALEATVGHFYQHGAEYGATHPCAAEDASGPFRAIHQDWVASGVRNELGWNYLASAMGIADRNGVTGFYVALCAAVEDVARWIWNEASQDGQALAPLHLPKFGG